MKNPWLDAWRQWWLSHLSGERLTAEDLVNLDNYITSISMEWERVMSGPADAPIGDEYCWDHDQHPQDGGWTCQTCRERSENEKNKKG